MCVVVLYLWTDASLFFASTISYISLLTPNLSPERIAGTVSSQIINISYVFKTPLSMLAVWEGCYRK